ncbi:MAG: hypothetical protein AB3N10_02520, partial [Allomuricauda sp.]
MGTRELLTYLEKLEIGLSSFSYEELGTEEAGKLKRSFDVFRTGLEDKVFGVPEMKQLDVIYEQVGIQPSASSLNDESFIKANSVTQLFTLIALLDKTNLDQRQREILRGLHKVGERLKTDDLNQSNISVQDNQQLIEKNLESFMTTSKVNLKP